MSTAMRKTANIASAIFGYLLLFLSFMVVIETVGRKWLGFSLQGVDELGGYILAITSGLAFTVALVDRAHIRIDLLYDRSGKTSRVLLDWLSLLLLTVLTVMMCYAGTISLLEAIEFDSTAPTPWATPLKWTQGIWVATLVLFMLTAFVALYQATKLLLAKQYQTLQQNFGLKVVSDELQDELAALEQRSGS